MPGDIWCTWSYKRVRNCPGHAADRAGHREVVSQLGGADEPRSNGALVVVWPDDYRRMEVWVASGANIGNWYCLGNEFGVPKTWRDPAATGMPAAALMMRTEPPARMPDGMIPLQPTWLAVLDRGPTVLLTAGTGEQYRMGWENGRRALLGEIETLAEDDSTCDPPQDG